MAASYTAERKAGTGSVFGTTLSITPASNCTTGSTLILIITTNNNVTSFVASSVTDTKGNTWRVDVTIAHASGVSEAICSSYQASGLTTSDTITVTFTGSVTSHTYWLEEFAGNYSGVDKVASITGSNSTTVGTGTTATTTAADEIAVCGGGITSGSATVTKNASYTAFPTGAVTTPVSGNAWYRILAATGTQNGDGTTSAMTNSAGVIATYKQTVVPSPARRHFQSNHVATMRPTLR